MTWGIPIALDLFFTGLGAGSFCFAALAFQRKGRGWEACSRMASFLAPFALAFGLLMLILDLGRKSRFWVTLGVFNYNSPMSIGIWLLSFFTLISVIFALFWVPEDLRKRIPWAGKWRMWNRRGYQQRLGMIGIPLALFVSIYTGVLLSVSSLPLWRNLSLPFLFCLSALSTGFAGGAILAMLSLGKKQLEEMNAPLRFLQHGYRIILSIFLLVVLIYIALLFISPVARSEAFNLILGWKGLIWWIGAVGIGIVLPLILIMDREEIGFLKALISFSCLLVGGFLLRLVLVIAGQT